MKFQNNVIRLSKNLRDANKLNHVFTITLKGDLPAYAREKGIKGDKWDMFLYVKGVGPFDCNLPALKPAVDSIVIQEVK